jgi:hypothetical protein
MLITIEKVKRIDLNISMERIIGMVLAIGRIILQEFWENPTSIEIDDVVFLEQSDGMLISNELNAFTENLNTILVLGVFLNDATDVHFVLSMDQERSKLGVKQIAYLLDIVSRLRYYSIELKSRIVSLMKHADKKREIMLSKKIL